MEIVGIFNMPQSCNMGQTAGFTSPPKEGMLRNFSPEKFGRYWTRDLGVPEVSMLTTRPPEPHALGLTQPLTEMNTRNISLELKVAGA
jgi:hypothetical protein